MAYIDQTYYSDTYMGVPVPADAFKRIAERASDVIDSLTGYKIDDITTLDAFSQKMVKKATAAQVEYLFQRGEEANHGSGNVTSANIGQFHFDDGNGANENLSREAIRTSPAVLSLLSQTGLLYTGVNTYDPFYPSQVINPYGNV